MDIVSIIVTAFALSADALAVSVTNGLIIEKLKFRQAFLIALAFGLFQAVMPVIGWAAGYAFRNIICACDHWIALGLLTFIGVKMIVESRRPEKEGNSRDCRHLPTLLLMAVATSIDALAVGITFAVLSIHIIVPVVFIGVITFAVCLAGVYLGHQSRFLCGKKIELVGGIILIGIGVRITIEHLIKHI